MPVRTARAGGRRSFRLPLLRIREGKFGWKVGMAPDVGRSPRAVVSLGKERR